MYCWWEVAGMRFCTGWMPFLSPYQQCQSTEGKVVVKTVKVVDWLTFGRRLVNCHVCVESVVGCPQLTSVCMCHIPSTLLVTALHCWTNVPVSLSIRPSVCLSAVLCRLFKFFHRWYHQSICNIKTLSIFPTSLFTLSLH